MARPKLIKALQFARRADIVKRSLIVSLIVGTALNLINQGDVIMNAGAINLWKCALTYVVPYLVATYGSVMSLLSIEAD